MSELSVRRDPIRLLLSRGLWTSVWYLLGYLAVGWALFAIALSTAVAGAALSITLAGLPVLVAAAAAIRWCADVERARLRPMADGPVAGHARWGPVQHCREKFPRRGSPSPLEILPAGL